MKKKKAIFLDRDGVINQAKIIDGRPYPPSHLGELILLPRVKEAIAALKEQGYLIFIITNQPDVARGITARETVEAIHDYLKIHLLIDAIYTCFHDDHDACDCRKPKPGLILMAAIDFDIDLSSSYMVGDRWRDIEAGTLAGVKTIFIDNAYEEKKASNYHFQVGSLFEALPNLVNKDVTDESNFKSKSKDIC